MDNDRQIEAPSRHTDDMIRHELDSMLGFGVLKVCLGHLMQLAQCRSPYVYGGKLSEEDVLIAMGVLKAVEMPPLEFHEALVGELDAAFRAYELYDDDDRDKDAGRRSEIEAFSPEWLADTIRCACDAVPSITLHDALWEVPLAMMMHLGVSTGRKNGAITRRPVDMKAVLEDFKRKRSK